MKTEINYNILLHALEEIAVQYPPEGQTPENDNILCKYLIGVAQTALLITKPEGNAKLKCWDEENQIWLYDDGGYDTEFSFVKGEWIVKYTKEINKDGADVPVWQEVENPVVIAV